MWSKKIRDAVDALEKKFGIDLVSLECHDDAVDEIEALRKRRDTLLVALHDIDKRAFELGVKPISDIATAALEAD